MAEQFRRYQPGDDQLSARDLNAQAEAAERQSGTFGVSGFNRKSVAGGESLTPGPSDNCWILILGVNGSPGAGCGSGPGAAGSGSNACASYDWAEVVFVGPGCVAVRPGDGRSGQACKFPAIEVNGNDEVIVGSVHRGWFRGDGTAIDFDASSGGGGFPGSTNCTPIITAIDWVHCTYTIKYITGNFTISDTPCPS